MKSAGLNDLVKYVYTNGLANAALNFDLIGLCRFNLLQLMRRTSWTRLSVIAMILLLRIRARYWYAYISHIRQAFDKLIDTATGGISM